MIQIDTKYKIGDKVCYPIPETVYEKITCPYCNGSNYINISPEEKIRCEMCDNGIYEKEIRRQVWSPPVKVAGAVIYKNFFTNLSEMKFIYV